MMHVNTPQSRDAALAYDANDPLASLRGKFKLPKDTIYLVGHSLGPASYSALDVLHHTAEEEWTQDIVRAWNSADWINLSKTVGAKLAPLLGAKAHEISVCDSVSVNLFKLAASALPHVKSKRIVISEDEFPTDQYIAQGLSDLSGAKLEKVSADIGLEALNGGGVLIKSAVCYRTAEIMDMALWETRARETGAIIVWDFSHATGIAPLDVAKSGAKLGAGCTYKYLNGGPGAPAFVYVCEDISEQFISPLSGWLGHKRPFDFDKTYTPADHAARFVSGTPSILSLSALSGALDVVAGIDMTAVFNKLSVMTSLALTRATNLGLKTTSPQDASRRGGHVSFIHEHGYPIVQALAARRIMADFRTPDTIRFGMSPLYVSLIDVWDAMDGLEEILKTESWNTEAFMQRVEVT